MASQAPPSGPPYLPQIWSLGGKPEKGVDIPICAVFIALFIGGAASHMTIFQINKRRGHKFLFSGLLFGFCMARIVTCIMRISSVALPHDVPLAIAAQIFAAAGVVLLFIVNLVFAQRLLRSSHPRWGWHGLSSAAFKALYALIIITIIMVITVVVQSYYTLDPEIHRIDRVIMLYGLTTFAVISFLPIPLIAAATLIPRKDGRELDRFGQGSWRYKTSMLAVGTILISFGACYRAGANWLTPVPMSQPMPGVQSKASFYIVNFTVEIITVYLYAISRVDKRFHVPDGAKEHKNYEKTAAMQATRLGSSHADDEEKRSVSLDPPSTGKSEDAS